MKKTVLLCLILLASVVLPARAGSIIVVAHTDVPVSVLSGDELQRIFLGKKTFWSGGRRIVPVCLKRGGTHESFLKSYMDMNVSQFDIFWRQAVFVGTGTPPAAFSSEREVIDFVRKTPGGVGYVDSSNVQGELKIIKVK